ITMTSDGMVTKSEMKQPCTFDLVIVMDGGATTDLELNLFEPTQAAQINYANLEVFQMTLVTNYRSIADHASTNCSVNACQQLLLELRVTSKDVNFPLPIYYSVERNQTGGYLLLCYDLLWIIEDNEDGCKNITDRAVLGQPWPVAIVSKSFFVLLLPGYERLWICAVLDVVASFLQLLSAAYLQFVDFYYTILFNKLINRRANLADPESLEIFVVMLEDFRITLFKYTAHVLMYDIDKQHTAQFQENKPGVVVYIT
ncbi:hypothetical protein ACJX0J_022646, partial [Zea mays]